MKILVFKYLVKLDIEAIDDPYVNPINNETLQDIYDNLPMDSIPENDDQIFEFEPNFTPKNTEDYIVKAEGDVEYLRDIQVYSKELVFPIKSKKRFSLIPFRHRVFRETDH
jgi:hypothetical protein